MPSVASVRHFSRVDTSCRYKLPHLVSIFSILPHYGGVVSFVIRNTRAQGVLKYKKLIFQSWPPKGAQLENQPATTETSVGLPPSRPACQPAARGIKLLTCGFRFCPTHPQAEGSIDAGRRHHLRVDDLFVRCVGRLQGAGAQDERPAAGREEEVAVGM